MLPLFGDDLVLAATAATSTAIKAILTFTEIATVDNFITLLTEAMIKIMPYTLFGAIWIVAVKNSHPISSKKLFLNVRLCFGIIRLTSTREYLKSGFIKFPQ